MAENTVNPIRPLLGNTLASNSTIGIPREYLDGEVNIINESGDMVVCSIHLKELQDKKLQTKDVIHLDHNRVVMLSKTNHEVYNNFNYSEYW